jgi:hypothetical protein
VSRRKSRLLLAVGVVVACQVSCGSRDAPVNVVMTFVNSWKIGGEPLTPAEQAVLKRAAIDTMRNAFAGFDLALADQPSRGARTIRVEDTPYGPMQFFGAAGVTYPTAYASSVRFDVLANLELAAVKCRDVAHCTAMPRDRLVEGLGRGVAATAAHELGHQAGFHFALDSVCDDCYDGKGSASFAHFFGRMHWSDRALQIMKRTLPQKGT